MTDTLEGKSVKKCILFWIGLIFLWPMTAHADWQAVEKIEPYSIVGKSGVQLYKSIGERGPKVGGNVRAIAHTNFKLTWSRKYEAQGDACVLVSARPKLIITYVLPKPSQQLPDTVKKSWDSFVAGVEDHERVHGETIKKMVRDIEAVSVGLTVANDRDCKKIREELTQRLSAISLAQRKESRDFDLVEMSNGGNIHQIILRLVNGP